MSQMRISRRADIELKADIFFNGRIYEGYIKNVSETGIGYLLTYSLSDNEKFNSLREVKMSFMAPSGDIFHLSCRMIWFSKTLPDGETMIVGMKITEPPSEYREWIEKFMSESEERKPDQSFVPASQESI